ncbi:MAG TPA: DUF4129 domain-containing protein, partial [Polyangiales bacterium]|nr:DUF4129 domain-containing protein [Polyangiales bacterium]
MLGWNSVLWFAGARHGYEPSSYERVCLHFDRAVGWLAALFVLKLLLRGQAGVNLNDGVTGTLVAAFFLFCIVALALARSRGSAQKRFVSRYRAASALLGIGSGIGMLALALSLLFLPQLTAAAKLGFQALLQVGGPLGSAFANLVFILLYLWWLIRGPHQAAPPLKKQYVMVDPRPQYREEAMIKLARDEVWLPWAARVLVAAIVFGFLFWLVWRFRQPQLAWRRALWAAWTRIRHWIALARSRPHEPEPVRLYRALCRWGRRSGIVARASETPLEYARRLQAQLPALQADITAIVAAFNAHVYAPRTQPPAAGFERERAALRRLHSPRL